MYPSYHLHDDFTYALIVSPELCTLVTWIWIRKNIHTQFRPLFVCSNLALIIISWTWDHNPASRATARYWLFLQKEYSWCNSRRWSLSYKSSENLTCEYEVKCWQLDEEQVETWRDNWSNNEGGVADSHPSGFTSSHLAQTRWTCPSVLHHGFQSWWKPTRLHL